MFVASALSSDSDTDDVAVAPKETLVLADVSSDEELEKPRRGQQE